MVNTTNKAIVESIALIEEEENKPAQQFIEKDKILLLNKAGEELFGVYEGGADEKKTKSGLFLLKEDISGNVKKHKRNGHNSEHKLWGKSSTRKDIIRHSGVACRSTKISNDKIFEQGKVIYDRLKNVRNYEELFYAKDSLKLLEKSFEQIAAEQTRVFPDVDLKFLQFQIDYMQSQFEVYKEQVNYHFLFNCLNLLSCIMISDVKKAQLFIEEFSNIYRYVLEATEKPLITLNKELEFIHSYLFLQHISIGDSLTYIETVPPELLQQLVPPLSLQGLIENAIKHNIINESLPLNIEISHDGCFLIVKNKIQLKISVTSTGLGHKNLINRYALISKLAPTFRVENNYYVARIPLIRNE